MVSKDSIHTIKKKKGILRFLARDAAQLSRGRSVVGLTPHPVKIICPPLQSLHNIEVVVFVVDVGDQ
jgi:hypothetical protein